MSLRLTRVPWMGGKMLYERFTADATTKASNWPKLRDESARQAVLAEFDDLLANRNPVPAFELLHDALPNLRCVDEAANYATSAEGSSVYGVFVPEDDETFWLITIPNWSDDAGKFLGVILCLRVVEGVGEVACVSGLNDRDSHPRRAQMVNVSRK